MGNVNRRRKSNRTFHKRTKKSGVKRYSEGGLNDPIFTGRDGIRTSNSREIRGLKEDVVKKTQTGGFFQLGSISPQDYFDNLSKGFINRNVSINQVQSMTRNNALFKKLYRFALQTLNPADNSRKILQDLVGKYWNTLQPEDVKLVSKALADHTLNVKTAANSNGYATLSNEKLLDLHRKRANTDLTRKVKELYDGPSNWGALGENRFINRNGQLAGARVTEPKAVAQGLQIANDQ